MRGSSTSTPINGVLYPLGAAKRRATKEAVCRRWSSPTTLLIWIRG